MAIAEHAPWISQGGLRNRSTVHQIQGVRYARGASSDGRPLGVADPAQVPANYQGTTPMRNRDAAP